VLEKVGERQKATEISLKLDDRIALARSERELQKELRETEAQDGSSTNAANDIILSETLNILSDLVIRIDQIQAGKEKLQAGTQG
jgi:bifunctional N-acetylglucosamine-1-phosphate-uridyltransferase/glucosamine-1-phosphate-acetyltransferase GlmU-like protein